MIRIARVFGLTLFLCACSSGHGAPSLDNTWAYLSGNNAEGVTFNSDGTYDVIVVHTMPNSTDVDAQLETGTFTTSGDTVTLTPEQSTCTGKDPVATYTYSFEGSSLALAQPSGVLLLQPDTAATPAQAAITYGCFNDAGVFFPSPLAPVTN